MVKRYVYLLLLLVLSATSLSAVECPLGLTDDPYPGSCGTYVDTNSDGLCDLGEQPKTVELSNTKSVTNPFDTKYNTLLIIILSILIYYGSYYFCKKDSQKMIFHKRLWNGVLLLTFFIVTFTSIIYLLRLDFAFDLDVSRAAFWHIEIGLVMIMVSIFHALWHLAYFKSYFQK